jgi:hypothetical protein
LSNLVGHLVSRSEVAFSVELASGLDP